MYQYFIIFLLPNNTPFGDCFAFCLFMDIRVVFTLALMDYAAINIYICVCEHMFSVLLGKYLSMK